MTEKQAITAAYLEQLRRMFAVFFDGVIAGSPDVAEDHFKQGLEKLRFARDRALKLIGGSPDASRVP